MKGWVGTATSALVGVGMLVGCGPKEVTREEWSTAEKAADRVLERVDNGDGTYSYALPEDFDPETRVRGKLLTWVYAGQARYAYEPKIGGLRTWTVEEPEPLSAEEKVLAGTRVDRWGRMWKVESIDEQGWAEAMATLQSPDEAEPDIPSSFTRPPGQELEPPDPVGTVMTVQPTAWDHLSCDGGTFSARNLHAWDGDERDPQSSPDGRARTSVYVSTGCSGVKLDNDEILTAAHCVVDDDNQPIDIDYNDLEVCPVFAPFTCIDALDIQFATTLYTGGSGDGGGVDPDDDWAIIELVEPFDEGASDEEDHMHLSTVTDTTLASLIRLQNLAMPEYGPNCADPVLYTTYHNEEDEPIAGIDPKMLRLKIDGSTGHSGGPIYYCPAGNDDVCAPSDMGHVIGVWSGWNSVSNRFRAAKVSSFASAATAYMND